MWAAESAMKEGRVSRREKDGVASDASAVVKLSAAGVAEASIGESGPSSPLIVSPFRKLFTCSWCWGTIISEANLG